LETVPAPNVSTPQGPGNTTTTTITTNPEEKNLDDLLKYFGEDMSLPTVVAAAPFGIAAPDTANSPSSPAAMTPGKRRYLHLIIHLCFGCVSPV
jgi:hypothetical protein